MSWLDFDRQCSLWSFYVAFQIELQQFDAKLITLDSILRLDSNLFKISFKKIEEMEK